jgi:NTE family protein
MVEHWGAGVRDVHLSMRHKDWLERPQTGETMVTYDLTADGAFDDKQEEKKWVR